MTEPFPFDHAAKADGQTVHCQRAAFFATSGVPFRPGERIQLGFWIGVGLTGGVVFAAGIIMAVSNLLKAVFS